MPQWLNSVLRPIGVVAVSPDSGVYCFTIEREIVDGIAVAPTDDALVRWRCLLQ